MTSWSNSKCSAIFLKSPSCLAPHSKTRFSVECRSSFRLALANVVAVAVAVAVVVAVAVAVAVAFANRSFFKRSADPVLDWLWRMQLKAAHEHKPA